MGPVALERYGTPRRSGTGQATAVPNDKVTLLQAVLARRHACLPRCVCLLPLSLTTRCSCGCLIVANLKGTLIEKLQKKFPNDQFGFSVSHTTRPPRPGEVDGVHYHFTTVEQIQKDIADGRFIEYAEVHGKYYGTRSVCEKRPSSALPRVT